MTAITGPGQMAGPSGKVGNQIPSGYKQGQMQQFTPEQMQLFMQMMEQIGPESFLAKLSGGDQGTFDEVEAPQKRQFADMLGGIGSKFSGMGMGGQKSSGFQNTMSSAASNFAQELGSKRQEMQMNALKELMGMSSNLLSQKPYDNFLVQKEDKGGLGGWGGAAGGFLGGLGGLLSPMPGGAAAGAKLGYGIGSGFD